jgi:hypothetical protein
MSKSSSPWGVFDMWTEWAKPQAEWAQGLAGWPNSLADRPGLKSVRPTASWTCVYMREEESQGARSHSTWPDRHMARPNSCHLVSYCLGQVGGAPPRPYKYHPPPVEIKTHTPHFGNSTCKSLILSAGS